MASGSTYPPAPEYFRLCGSGRGIAPPQPVDGEYTVFGQTANSSVNIPKLLGRDLIEVDNDGSVGGLPYPLSAKIWYLLKLLPSSDFPE
jgi:hypothetical protein